MVDPDSELWLPIEPAGTDQPSSSAAQPPAGDERRAKPAGASENGRAKSGSGHGSGRKSGGNGYAAEQIQVLEGLEPVRRRPGMYIGDTDVNGLHHLVYEIIDNSVDEALAGECNEIEVRLSADGSCTVSDNGRGIPVDLHQSGRPALEVVMTKLHAGGKFGGGGYKVSGGLHGVGLSVVNALSERVEVVVYRDHRIHRQEYARGVPLGDLRSEPEGRSSRRGTTVKFWPDPEIFRNTRVFRAETVVNRLRELAFLNKRVHFRLIDERQQPWAETNFYFEGGIEAFVRHLNRGKGTVQGRPMYVEREIEGSTVEAAIQYNGTFTEHVLAYANNINTIEGGSHLTGLRAALTATLSRYARRAGIL